jgi:zinc-binding alcohol dehydrogenase/oxidoreductase
MGSSEDFKEVMKLVCDGKIKPTIDKLMPLEKGARAYQKLSSGEQFGKIILVP